MKSLNSWFGSVSSQMNQLLATDAGTAESKTATDDKRAEDILASDDKPSSKPVASVGAGEKVAAAAPPLVTTLKAQFESPLIDFDQQQRRFAAEQSHDAVVGGALPWCGAGVADVNALKKNILSLSLDSRNFVRAPPSGSDFHFTLADYGAVAQCMLTEDPNLSKIRFQLVPKTVSEEHFWRNYFYRVSLIVRQSTTSVPSDDAGSNDEQRCIDDASFEDDTPPTVTEAELDQVREQLGIMKVATAGGGADKPIDKQDDSAEQAATTTSDNWEDELITELNDYELISEQTGKSDTQWEKEITDLLDQH